MQANQWLMYKKHRQRLYHLVDKDNYHLQNLNESVSTFPTPRFIWQTDPITLFSLSFDLNATRHVVYKVLISQMHHFVIRFLFPVS